MLLTSVRLVNFDFSITIIIPTIFSYTYYSSTANAGKIKQTLSSLVFTKILDIFQGRIQDFLQCYSQSRRLLSYWPFPAERKNVYGDPPYRMVSPEAVLYSGRKSGGFVKSALSGQTLTLMVGAPTYFLVNFLSKTNRNDWIPLAYLKEGAPGTPGPNSFIFMQFSAKILQNNPNLGVGANPSGKSWIHHWIRPCIFHNFCIEFCTKKIRHQKKICAATKNTLIKIF